MKDMLFLLTHHSPIRSSSEENSVSFKPQRLGGWLQGSGYLHGVALLQREVLLAGGQIVFPPSGLVQSEQHVPARRKKSARGRNDMN